jgi:hypothetical protein
MRRDRRKLLGSLATGIALGVGIGVAARLARTQPAATWWASLGGPWLTMAFAAGALTGGRRRAALAGAAAIVAGTVTYYALMVATTSGGAARYAAAMVVAWSLAGAAIGAFFGRAGAAWRRGRASWARLAGAATLGGALIGEAVLLQAAWDSPWAQRALMLELTAGVTAAVVLARDRRAAGLALSLGAAGVFLVAEVAVRETLRVAGWVGA